MLEDQVEFCDDVIVRNSNCGAGLASLKDRHKSILSHLIDKQNSEKSDEGIKERCQMVTDTLERLDVGIEESAIISTLSEHFDTLDSDQAIGKLNIMKAKEENDWLRDELEDVEKRLEEALVKLAGLEEEKKHWVFMEEVRQSEQEADIRPVTPSKIPVGAFRVEEEKAINRALNAGPADSNRQALERSTSPAAPSRIPKFGSGLGVNYKRVQDSIEKASTEQQENRQKMFGKSHKLSLTPATSYSNIPAR